MKQHIINFFKGLGVGASMLLPGVSGGTMAIMLNIYDDLIYSVGSFFKNKRKNAILLLTFGIGGLLGIFLCSKPILYLTTTYEKPMMFLFLGAMIASLPTLYKKTHIKKFKPYMVAFPLIGVLIVVIIAFLPKDLFVMNDMAGLQFMDMIFLGIAGIVCAVALVLPGISLSYVLLIFGMYEPTMEAIQSLNLAYLLPIAVGGFLGLIATTKILEMAMEKHGGATYLVIMGFLISSFFDVFPGIPTGIEWIICPIMFVGGFAAIYFIGRRAAE